MPDFFAQIFNSLYLTQEFDQWLMLALLAVCALVMFLRAVLCVGYQGQYASVKASTKEVKSKSDVDKIKSRFLKRAARDYADLGERGVSRINSRELAEKSALRLSFLGWNYKGAEAFVKAFETAFLLLGVLLSFLADNSAGFAAVCAGLFVVIRLFAAFFDFTTAKEKLIAETSFILDREIGKLFLTDTPASISNLKTELKEAIAAHSKFLEEAVKNLGAGLSGAMSAALSEMSISVEKTLTSVSAEAETVRKPLESWRASLVETEAAFGKMNGSALSMSASVEGFGALLEKLDAVISGYKAEIEANNTNMEKQLEKLNRSAEALAGTARLSSAQSASLEASLEYIKTNQIALEKTVEEYEAALKDIAAGMGDGLGRIISFRLQEAYSSLAEGAAENIKQASAANGELLARMQSLFDGLLEQSRNETTLIMRMKEQFELEIAELKKTVAR